MAFQKKTNPLPAPVPPHFTLYPRALFCYIKNEDKIIQFAFILGAQVTYATK